MIILLKYEGREVIAFYYFITQITQSRLANYDNIVQDSKVSMDNNANIKYSAYLK